MPLADLAASFQAAVVDVLAVKTAAAARATGARTVLIAGGVAASTALRLRLQEAIAAEFAGVDAPALSFPPFAYCTDNAAMIAGAAYHVLRRGELGGWSLDIDPRLPMGAGR
jgi:N6-L-threonylcarbamoyladenine synthase